MVGLSVECRIQLQEVLNVTHLNSSCEVHIRYVFVGAMKFNLRRMCGP